MTTKFPGSAWRPLGTQTQPTMRAHDIICLHTMVGYLSSTYSMFRQNGYGGTESHFGIGGRWGGDNDKGYDGDIWQFQDLDFSADANLEGNRHIISIETADNAPQSASNIAEWTPKQIDSIVVLVAWLCRKYDIPPFLIKDTKPGRRGIAYHRQGVEHSDGLNSHPGFLVSGGERWSTSRGKECPGSARIKQLSGIVIPRVQDVLNGDDLNMDEATVLRIVKKALTDDATVKTLADMLFKADVVQAPDADLKAHPENPTWGIRSYLNRLNSVTVQNSKEFKALQDKLDKISATPGSSDAAALAEIQNTLNQIRDNVVPKQP